MKLKSKIILFILMITLLLNLKPNIALANTCCLQGDYMMLVTTNSYLRSSNSSSSSIITTIPANRTVICTSTISNNFIQVYYSGITGYVSANNLKSIVSNISFRKVTSDELVQRSGPSASDDTITKIPKNEIVLYWGNATSDFAEVSYNDRIGWVSRKSLATLKPGDTSLNPSTQSKDNWRLVNADSLDFRSNPSNNAQLLNTIPKYSKVEYLGEKSGTSPNIFAKVKYNGETGWVLAKNLSTFKCSQISDSSRLVLSNLTLRNGPANSYNVKLTIPKGSVVTYSGKKQNGFAEVSYKGNIGWVSASSLSKFNYNTTFVSYNNPFYLPSYSFTANEISNIELISKTLTQTIIMPGESFSALNILGDCTEENGYKSENTNCVYINSTIQKPLIHEYYGGYTSMLSHISFSIFHAINDLGIFTYYDSCDVKFVNTLNKPIMLTLVSTNGNCACMVYTLDAK